MRFVVALNLAIVFAPVAIAQPKVAPRFTIEWDGESFPQANAKDAFASVIKAIDQNRIDYLLAHLVEPDYVDRRVAALGGKFDRIVDTTRQKFADDPESVKELKRFLNDGQYEEAGDTATVKLKGTPRLVYLKKVGDRWYFENRQKAK